MSETVVVQETVTVNPATGEELARYPQLDAAGRDAALDRAVAAQSAWREVPVSERVVPLRELARLLRDEAEDHARLMSLEMGKPITEALAEVRKCALTCDYYADHAEDFLAPQPVATEAASSFVTYEPLGVVLAVMPWNFPFWQVIRFCAPTLAAGNGGILKHASNVTGSALAIADLVRRAGFPEDLFQTVVVGHSAIDDMIADPRIAAVTLTGSEGAGASVAAAAGRALKKTVLELGGSDPFVVLDDADLDTVVPLGVKARFINTGQSCLCAKRFPVEAGVHEEFVARAGEAARALRVGDPLDPATQIGPLAKPSFVDDIDRQVRESVAMGARVVAGGHRIEGPGCYYAPTVLADVTSDMPVFREETFGPVMAIVKAADAAEAIALADDTRYGLAASVWTADMARGLELGRGIRSGALFVNAVVASDPRLPFGGVKLSGYGRELSREGMLEFTNIRAVWAMEGAS
ncbi:NAD-dependent succinate-semialdehyde dehydrogenase [Demequina pelophila]|uniref:NAD-dependent succinate-semialdehyde dehydrogenase n=1 Tax=Demequina pelophila TaxID=1638984 RepID=UPI00078283A2|nr:NAD-dependent succinate-semialdehyde dehydrogenase [Demequina pelophila]